MIIAGMQKTSLVDYPGNICTTIFLYGCNFRCKYCHNPGLVTEADAEKIEKFSEDDVILTLHKRKRFIDGVCITGGEPTLSKKLPEFLVKIKKIGFKIKLDTNGSNPEMLKKLIDAQLVDYIAMDIKGPIDKYSEIADVNVDISKIKETVKLLMNSSVDYEFRTTVVKEELDLEDIKKIGSWLNGAKKYSIQQFVGENEMIDPEYKGKLPYTPEELKMIAYDQSIFIA